MVDAGLIHSPKQQVPSPVSGAVCPAYYLGAKGRDVLLEKFDDPTLFGKPVSLQQRPQLEHCLAVAQTQLSLRAAANAHPTVSLVQWYHEFETLNPLLSPAEQFGLFSELQSRPRIVCNPDAAFMLQRSEDRVVYYLEQERGGTGAHQVYARKHKGYEFLMRQKDHCRHFPDATYRDGFTVLCVAKSIGHRTALLAAFKEKPQGDYWRFAAASEIDSETFLSTPVWYRAGRDKPSPLIRPSA